MAELQKRNVRKYYKYTQPNGVITGSLIFENGILSNFTSNKTCLTTGYCPTYNTFNNQASKIEFKFKVFIETSGNYSTFIGTHWGFAINAGSDGNTYLHLSSDRGSWNITNGLAANNLVPLGQWFYYRLTYDGATYISEYSLDDVEYINLHTVASTLWMNSRNNLTIGGWYYGLGGYCSSRIDLKECYIKVDDIVEWRGLIPTEATEEDYDFYKDEVEYYAPIEDKEKYYIQDEYKRLRLYDTTNRSYIDANNHFIVDSVTAWSTIQTYTLEPNIIANKIRIRAMDSWVEANSGWIFVVMARCMDNSVHYRWLDWGYNVAPRGTHFVEFPSNNHIKQITIYAYCYRSSTSYCYGRIRVALDYTKLIETTKEKAIITKKDKEVVVNAIGAYRKPKQLADGFLQLEHIQCNGNQRIFTDYYPKLPATKIRYICEFMTTHEQCLWCARGATTTTLTNTMFKLAGGLRFDYNATSYQTSACRNTQYIYEIVQDGVNLYVNGALKYTCALSTFNCDSPLQFFACYNAGITANLGYFAFLKCYLIEIYENNVLVRRYVPCERVIDKVYGLYDTVNNAFFSNSWNGYNFTRGDYIYEDSDVNDFTIYNSKAYFEATSV